MQDKAQMIGEETLVGMLRNMMVVYKDESRHSGLLECLGFAEGYIDKVIIERINSQRESGKMKSRDETILELKYVIESVSAHHPHDSKVSTYLRSIRDYLHGEGNDSESEAEALKTKAEITRDLDDALVMIDAYHPADSRIRQIICNTQSYLAQENEDGDKREEMTIKKEQLELLVGVYDMLDFYDNRMHDKLAEFLKRVQSFLETHGNEQDVVYCEERIKEHRLAGQEEYEVTCKYEVTCNKEVKAASREEVISDLGKAQLRINELSVSRAIVQAREYLERESKELKEKEDEKLAEYRVSVDASTLNMFARGERFFCRKNPNVKDGYETQFQVGIGVEKEMLIDNHAAKVWDEDHAKAIVDAMNVHYSTKIGVG